MSRLLCRRHVTRLTLAATNQRSADSYNIQIPRATKRPMLRDEKLSSAEQGNSAAAVTSTPLRTPPDCTIYYYFNHGPSYTDISACQVVKESDESPTLVRALMHDEISTRSKAPHTFSTFDTNKTSLHIRPTLRLVPSMSKDRLPQSDNARRRRVGSGWS